MQRALKLGLVPQVLFGLALAACGGAESGLPTAARAQPVQPAADSSPDVDYLNPDGTVNYALLHQTFGEPNENLTLNPRATDVAQTSSVGSVTNLPDRLVFAGSAAGWLQGHIAGDTLYCNHLCGGQGFLRNIVTIQAQGDQVVVMTTNGKLTDVVWNGWLHGSGSYGPIPAVATDGQGGDGPTVVGQSASDSVAAPRVTVGLTEGTKSLQYGFSSSHISGNVKASASIDISLTADVVISSFSVGLFYLHLPKVQLVYIEASATASAGADADFKATASYQKSWNFWTPKALQLGVIDLGPVEVTPQLLPALTGSVNASGGIELQASASVTGSLDFGFDYTAKNGFQVIDGASWSKSAGISISGQVSLAATVDFNVSLVASFYDLGGPELVADISLDSTASDTATATVSSDGDKCGDVAKANVDLDLSGSVGLKIDPFGLDTILNDQKQIWGKTIPLASVTYNIPCPTAHCGSSPACASGSVCIVPANLCDGSGYGGITGATDCQGPSAAIGLKCTSNSDCGTNSGLSCESCSNLGCSGSCCQFN
jgi:hypothetical protein